MKKLVLTAAAIVSIAASATPVAAASFTFEDTATGSYRAFTTTDGSLGLTVTSATNGFVLVANSGVSALGRSVIGSTSENQVFRQFTPLRFSFTQALSSVTFLFGDGGGDTDSPVSISTFNAANVLLGTQSLTSLNDDGGAASLTLNFADAVSFVASSGSTIGNENSIFFEVSSATVQDAVPEPTTWGLMLLGFGMAGAAMRSRRHNTRVSFA